MIYRNKKLLAHAKHSPRCFCCGASNDGTVVAAHANGSEYGKGMGQKAHDWAIAYVCYTCHMEIDQGKQTREERKDMWLRAHIRTMAYLFDSGILGAK